MSDRKVNIREVARVAGVSVASVSRALNGVSGKDLSEKQRRHILDVCAKLQYTPNEHARRIFSGHSNTVSVFFPPFKELNNDECLNELQDANFGSCLMGMQQELSRNGIGLLLNEVSEEFLGTRRHISMVRGKQVDGILLWGVLEEDEYLQELLSEKVPLVLVQTKRSDCSLPFVVADDYVGMSQLTERVLAAGHRHIAIIRPFEFASAGQARLKGILDTLENAGIAPSHVSSGAGFSYSFGECAAAEILTNAPQTTCIMASNDLTAFGCIKLLKERGISVPEQISVTGADGLKIPGMLLELDSFRYPSFEIGRRGAELLIKQIRKEAGEESVTLPVIPITGKTLSSSTIESSRSRKNE